jgi:predicted ATPase/class 3 adenylate cyclase
MSAAQQPSGEVTLVFSDIEGSTNLLHELGTETYRDALAEHRRVVREAYARYRGYEVDYEGDAFFYVFSSAPDAVSAVADAMAGLEDGPIRIRVGIHTGEPVLDPPKYVGLDVHFAARVMSSAHGGQVVLSSATASLLDDRELISLGSHRLKDIDEPVRLYQLGDGSFPALKTIANTNLPTPASSFLGREEELHAADRLLQSTRLLTIHGPGGQGKTRFALELATRAREARFTDYADGVFACFLASVRDPSLVLPTIAQTLQVAEQPDESAGDALAAHLRGKKMLLLLDNLEQVLECGVGLSRLLSACPKLTLLVTSRELVRIQGEEPYPLPPLPEAEGVVLFCERSKIEPSETIREIASRLEGLPLAIELAAARTRSLSPPQLLERLSSRLDLLKGFRDTDPRQQTLRATIQWSYDLLGPEERQAFVRLSVFVGGCTLDAAEEVCAADLDALQSLVEKSLLRFTDERFWMLETIREFAAELLAGDERADGVRRRHARFLSSYLAEPQLLGRAEWMLRLESERENLRSALAWALDNDDVETCLTLASEYGWLCMSRGPLAEGLSFLESALARDDGDTSARARAHWGLGTLAWRQGDPELAGRSHQAALEVARRVGDVRLEARSLRALGILAAEELDAERSESLLNEALAAFREIDDRDEVAECQLMLGYGALLRGAYEVARGFIEEALTVTRERGDPRGTMRCVGNLAEISLHQKRFPEALELAREGLVIAHELVDVGSVGGFIAQLAWIGAELGSAERSAVLLGGADALYEATESSLDSMEREQHDRATTTLVRELERGEVDRLTAIGRAMPVDELVVYALECAEAVLTTARSRADVARGAISAPRTRSR